MLRFDRVDVDVDARVVELDGERRHLEPQAFDLLIHLIRHRERVVPKAELLDEVWGDQFVSESALTTRIKEIRRAVGDDGKRQAVVRNVRGRGYRFVAELEPATGDGSDPVGELPPVATLHGRDEDLADVLALLDDSPVVTVVGPGGVGKTTLVTELARVAGRRFADGIGFAALADISDAADVVPLVRSAARLDASDSGWESLPAALAELDLLLVLDNCEHVVDEVARLVGDVVARSPTIRILSTSRERLGVRGEQVRPLRPLAADAARALLVERARSLDPGWSPPAAADLDQLTGLVDRLPLALEMTAARLPAVGSDELLGLLSERLDVLRSPDRDVEDRHRTLAGLIAWSEDLLGSDARRLLVDLSVFAGPVPAADIAAVVDEPVAELVVGPLTELVDRSLLVADVTTRPSRYRLLETVKASVAARRRPELEARHAVHVTEELEAADRLLRTPDEPDGASRIDDLRNEARAAHRWAREHDVDLGDRLVAALLHHSHERQWTEPAAWSEAVRTRVGDDALSLAHAAAVAADASNRGDYELARRLGTHAMASDDHRIAASAHDTLANVGLYVGDLDTTMRHADSLIELADRSDDPVPWLLGMLGRVLGLCYAGRRDAARRLLHEARVPGRLNHTGRAWLAYAAGEIVLDDDPERAIEHFDRAIELASEVGSSFVVGVSRTSALSARIRLDDVGAALDAFAPVLDAFRRSGSLTHAATALRNLVLLLVRAGRDEFAVELMGALSGPDVKSTYGVESDQLDGARQVVLGRHPGDLVERWERQGSDRSVRWALDRAIAGLDAETGGDGS